MPAAGGAKKPAIETKKTIPASKITKPEKKEESENEEEKELEKSESNEEPPPQTDSPFNPEVKLFYFKKYL